MKVKTKCTGCKTILISNTTNIKKARAIKKRYKQNKYTCWKCQINKRCEEF